MSSIHTALVVEDYRPERLLLKSRLQRLSFHVIESPDGRTAMRHLAETRFDLACLDLMLPEISGLHICETIRRSPRHANLPVLIVSGRGLPEDRAQAAHAGASAYLVKPFDWIDFDAEVRRLVGRPPPPSRVDKSP